MKNAKDDVVVQWMGGKQLRLPPYIEAPGCRTMWNFLSFLPEKDVEFSLQGRSEVMLGL